MMERGRRIALAGSYIVASAAVFYLAAHDREAQGESGGFGDGWEWGALMFASLAIGAAINRLWAVSLPPFAAIVIGWPIAWLVADGHALANLLIGLPFFAIVHALFVGIGVGARRLFGNQAG